MLPEGCSRSMNGGLPTSVIKDRADQLVVVLVETVQARLKIVSGEVSIEGDLASGIGRSAIVRGGDGHVVRRAVEVGGIVVIERGDHHQCFRVERVYPRKVREGIAFMLAITQADAWVLRNEAVFSYWSVLDVVRVGIIRNLVVVLAQRGHEPEPGLTNFSPPSSLFSLDHDQRNTLNIGGEVTLPWRSYGSTNVYYGSGFSNAFPGQPYPGDHLPQHTTFDLSLGKDFGERFSASLHALNVANCRVELDNSQTFGGFHWNNPREIHAEVRYRFHY